MYEYQLALCWKHVRYLAASTAISYSLLFYAFYFLLDALSPLEIGTKCKCTCGIVCPAYLPFCILILYGQLLSDDNFLATSCAVTNKSNI